MTRYTQTQLDRMNLAGRQESAREMIAELKQMAHDYMALPEHPAPIFEAFRDSSIRLAELIRHAGLELTDIPWIELTKRRVLMVDENTLVDWIIDNARGLAQSLLTLREGGLDKLLALSNVFPDAGMPISFAEREGWNIVWENLPDKPIEQPTPVIEPAEPDEVLMEQRYPNGSMVLTLLKPDIETPVPMEVKMFAPRSGWYALHYGGATHYRLEGQLAPMPEGYDMKPEQPSPSFLKDTLVKINMGEYVGKVGKVDRFDPDDEKYVVMYGNKETRVPEWGLEVAPRPAAQSVAVNGFSVPVGVMGQIETASPENTSSPDVDSLSAQE